jgi:hypothetical protein
MNNDTGGRLNPITGIDKTFLLRWLETLQFAFQISFTV